MSSTINISNTMLNESIIATSREHLSALIREEIKQNGFLCSLNHINVSNITDMTELFIHSGFNGDISQWDVSNVTIMDKMFCYSKFNGNISNWNVSKVKNMHWLFSCSSFNNNISTWEVSSVTNMKGMFYNSEFNGDISEWNVSNVINMNEMFEKSLFNGNISKWKPLKLEKCENFMAIGKDNFPYWAHFQDNSSVVNAIYNYELHQKLNKKLPRKNMAKRPKI